MTRVDVNSDLLRWACERAGAGVEELRKRFPRLQDWEQGKIKPTLKQLEEFAKAMYVPIGYLFLPEPPQERTPIPDLRTIADRGVDRPSPNLLDTIYLCQRRQEWYREFAQLNGERPYDFVGSATIQDPPEQVAKRMRVLLKYDMDARRTCPTWIDALRLFIEQAEEIGAMVMISGVVGSNTHRNLDPDEFRGFTLSDALAPLVFINGADTKAAQIFTLAHELAHLWLGESALSNVSPASSPTQRVESWCNRVAAEFLVPHEDLRQCLTENDSLGQVQELAKTFKVSTLVILRRLHDARRITRAAFDQAYQDEYNRLVSRPRSSGGDFYLTQPVRVSRRFARALVVSTLEGQTLYRDAFQMLGIAKEATLRHLGHDLGLL